MAISLGQVADQIRAPRLRCSLAAELEGVEAGELTVDVGGRHGVDGGRRLVQGRVRHDGRPPLGVVR